MHTLHEKNASLRERVLELSGVISRWQEEFVGSSEARADSEGGAEEEPQTRAARALQEAHEQEISLRRLTEQQRGQVLELEEALVVSLGQVSHGEEREGGLREVLEGLRRAEADLKHRAAVQVSRVKQVRDSAPGLSRELLVDCV